MCQNSTDSQKPLSGACAKVHGQGTAQLQLSNQSPTICQLGTLLIRALRSDAMPQTLAGFAAAAESGNCTTAGTSASISRDAVTSPWSCRHHSEPASWTTLE